MFFLLAESKSRRKHSMKHHLLYILLGVTLVHCEVFGFRRDDLKELKNGDLKSEDDGKKNIAGKLYELIWQKHPKPPVTMPGLILAAGYPAEVHHVTTEDGYILELHRIPGPRVVANTLKEGSLRAYQRYQHRKKGKSRKLKRLKFKRENNQKKKISPSDPSNNIIDDHGEHRKSLDANEHMYYRRSRQTETFLNDVSNQEEMFEEVEMNETSNKLGTGTCIMKTGRVRLNDFYSVKTYMCQNSQSLGKSGVKPFRMYYPIGLSLSTRNSSFEGSSSGTAKETDNEQKNSSLSDAKQFALRKETKRVVFIQHCFQCSSADFVLNDHNEALAFILADAGYDVWMGNFRGNQYSRRHVRLSTKHVNYWKFSIDDMAMYDLPAMVNHVLETTGLPDLSYVGHSLGTMTFFMAASTNRDFHSKVRVMVAMAPSGYLDHMTGGLNFMLKGAQKFYRLFERLGFPEMGSVLPWRSTFMRRICKPRSLFFGFCTSFLPSLNGNNAGFHDQEYLPFLLANFPSGTSLRIMAQLGQFIGSNGIQKFDFGRASENLRVYGNTTPPHYPLGAITVPTAIMWAMNDPIVAPEDVMRTVASLGNVVLNYRVPHKSFNHVDFLFADLAKELVYDRILQLLREY